VRRTATIKRRIDAIREESPLHSDDAVTIPGVYDSHRARGARHQAALRALAFKWIRILHRCWLDRVPYDESRYLMALQKRSASLLKHAAQNSD
jgi:hypothetical protein